MAGRTTRHRMIRISSAGADGRARSDRVAVEEPLELRVSAGPPSVTMRTPGDDLELAHGLLLSEGVITRREDVLGARFCEGGKRASGTYNMLEVELAPHVTARRPARTADATSACGVCGAESIAGAVARIPGTPAGEARDAPHVSPAVLLSLPATLRAHQRDFERTGGLHGAGLFDTADGEPLCVREDVGRHNAVDKVLGWALMENRLPLTDAVLLVSSRASFEIVQKAATAGVRVIGAVSAPSSLAIEMAEAASITLAALIRDDGMNVYCGEQRIAAPPQRR